MSHRFVASLTATAAVLVAMAITPASAQTLAAAKGKAADKLAAAPAAALRTADGRPDLSGVWSNATNIPLERPQNLGAKEFYTKEETAALARRTARPAAADRAGTAADVHYDLSQFGLDRSHTVVAPSMRTSLITGPEGRIPAVLPEAQKRQAERAALNRGHQFDGPENRGLSERCIMWPNEGPPMLPAGYNSNLQIVQGQGYVAVMQEMIHDVRVIPTDGHPNLPSNVRQWFGDSRGRWEGDTLVVETTNFTARTAFRGSSENLKVTERFSRVDENNLKYEFTVEDPATWAKPWSAEIMMAKIDRPIYEYACQEGNYGLRNILSGARVAEKDAAAKGAK